MRAVVGRDVDVPTVPHRRPAHWPPVVTGTRSPLPAPARSRRVVEVDDVAETVGWTWVPTLAEQVRIDTVVAHAGVANAGPSPLEALRFADEIDAENTAAALEVTAQGGATGLDLDGLDDAAARAGLAVGHPLVERARDELLVQALDVAGDRSGSRAVVVPPVPRRPGRRVGRAGLDRAAGPDCGAAALERAGQVALLLAAGRSDAQIRADLGLSRAEVAAARRLIHPTTGSTRRTAAAGGAR